MCPDIILKPICFAPRVRLKLPVVLLSPPAVAKQAFHRHHGTALLLLWFPGLQDVAQPYLV